MRLRPKAVPIAIAALMSCFVAQAAVPGRNMDCSDPQTDSARALCARQQWDMANDGMFAALNKVKNRLLAKRKTLGTQAGEALKALNDSQHSWGIYSDRTCKIVSLAAPPGGSEAALLQYRCLTARTTRRTNELNEIAEVLGN